MKSRAQARRKGNEKEAEVQAYFEARRYFVDRAVQTGVMVPCAPRPCRPCKRCNFSGRITSFWLSRSNDRWGVFDMLCEAPDQPKLLAVQVTVFSGASARRKKMLEVAHNFNLDRTDILLYLWHEAPRSKWTAERLVVDRRTQTPLGYEPADFEGDPDPTERRYPLATYRFEKLGDVDIPKLKPKPKRTKKEKPEDDGESPGLYEGEEHPDEEEDGEDPFAEADPFA